ncbi:unnamed protein product [Prorocentrum cordatum]|uniref:Uncharacterized protein n=1 Tax=Prorocentrum cordatum TaxID=2364126 RepID=A0ABN9XBG6_9DINO|nr:unnamed protein product [Polarella glacialis]
MFPSLRGNPVWERAWASHGALSLDPLASRAWGFDHMLGEEGDNPALCARSQYDIDEHRDACQGCSACALIAATWILDGLQGVDPDVLASRSRVNSTVYSGAQAWDCWEGDRSGGGLAESIVDKLSNERGLSIHVESETVLQADRCHLTRLLEKFRDNAMLGAILTIPDEGPRDGEKEHTGKSCGVFRHAGGYELMDSHRHDIDGQVAGTLIYTCKEASEVAEFVFAPSGLLCMMKCDPNHVDVAVAIDIQDIIRANDGLSIVQAVAPFYPRLGHAPPDCDLTPGDFPKDHYQHDLLRQFLLYGMKISSLQDYMFEKQPSGNELSDLVPWAIDGLLHGPRDAVAVAHHGDIAYATGPLPVLTQAGIVTKHKPFPGAAALPLPRQERFVAMDPTKCLRDIQAAIASRWPDGAPVAFKTGVEVVMFQRDLADVFRGCLQQALNYIPAWHARKITWSRLGGLKEPAGPSDFYSARVGDLVRARPDSKGGLSLLPPRMRLSTLCSAFGHIHPMLFSLAYCQWTNLGVGAEWAREHGTALSQAAKSFIRENGFAPRPKNLVKLFKAVPEEQGHPREQGEQEEGHDRDQEGDAEPPPKRARVEPGDEFDEEEAECGDAVDIFHRLWEFQDAQLGLVEKEEFMPAHVMQKRQAHLVAMLAKARACKVCGIQKPSRFATQAGREEWRGLTCWYCRNRDPRREGALASLELRVHMELAEARDALACTIPGSTRSSIGF